jgi:hypothetical protein
MTNPTPRPATIRYGVACLGLSLLIGVAILQYAWGEPAIALICLIVVGGLIALALRYGWARWVITLMAIASLLITWPMVEFQLSYGALISPATAAQLALELVGCVFLFLPGSHRWYYRSRAVLEDS